MNNFTPHTQINTAPIKKAIRFNSNVCGAGVVLIFALSLLIGLVWQKVGAVVLAFFAPGAQEMAVNLFSFLFYCISIGVPVVIMIFALRMPVSAAMPFTKLRLDLVFAGIGMLLGTRIIASVLVSRLSELITSVTGLTPTMPDIPFPKTAGGFIFYFLSTAIFASILEEIFFRGVVMQSLRRFGDVFALIVSSILFALAHGNLIQGPYSFLLGLLMGYLVMYTGSLWAGLILHFVNNSLAVLTEYLIMAKGYDYETFALYFILFSVIAFVASIVFVKKRYGSLFYLARGDAPLPEKSKYFAFFTAVFVIVAFVASGFQTWIFLR